jgi:hypothetical protein
MTTNRASWTARRHVSLYPGNNNYQYLTLSSHYTGKVTLRGNFSITDESVTVHKFRHEITALMGRISPTGYRAAKLANWAMSAL